MSDKITLASLLGNESTTAKTINDHMASLGSAAARIDELRSVPGGQMAKLYKLCADAPPLDIEELVPTTATSTIIFEGKNSLPAFSSFQKRFIRKDGVVVGYNHQTMSFITGPGYFTVVPVEDRPKELLFDYTKVPTAAGADGWPAPKANTSGFSYFVYRNMYDYCRRVGPGVLIGSATRLGKPIDSYFILGRSDS